MGDIPDPLQVWATNQRDEQKALQFLSHKPFLGDCTGSRPWDYRDPDPTWWSDKCGAQLVGRDKMLAAIERHCWRPRGLCPREVEALKRVLARPTRPPPGTAKIARKPNRRVRGLDLHTETKAAPPPKRQPRLTF